VYVVCPAVEDTEVSEEEQADLLMERIGIEGDLLDGTERDERPPLRSAVRFSAELAEALPGIRVDFLHGKLSAKEKEKRMRDFVSAQTDVLVSTTVIEVGVNVPEASLMIVENAERFGLSQLHQLRGRVGRGVRKSYCILVSDEINREGGAKERLLTLKSSYDGYAIAEKDLAMRGPGDFLRGSGDAKVRQSGGVRFRLAELCDDTGLMSVAFGEARALIEADPALAAHPALLEQVAQMFAADPHSVN
jgi:ATP-dependent DNA helicase RecG